jgi:hypothetical protein
MTIFKYNDGSKEIFLGWDIEGEYFKPVFRVRDGQFVDFFDKYFDILYKRGIPLGSSGTSSVLQKEEEKA